MNKGRLTEEKVAEFRCAFDLFDEDHDGYITAEELGKVIRSLGQTPSIDDLKEMIKEVDKDGNGTIEFDEFLTLMECKMKDDDSEEELMEAFKVFDKGNLGLISKNDIKQVMKMMGEILTQEELDDLMDQWDQDKDGLLNFDEFKKMMSFL